MDTIPLEQLKTLFPAHAGVILGRITLLADDDTVPRTRGGDPLCANI